MRSRAKIALIVGWDTNRSSKEELNQPLPSLAEPTLYVSVRKGGQGKPHLFVAEEVAIVLDKEAIPSRCRHIEFYVTRSKRSEKPNAAESYSVPMGRPNIAPLVETL